MSVPAPLAPGQPSSPRIPPLHDREGLSAERGNCVLRCHMTRAGNEPRTAVPSIGFMETTTLGRGGPTVSRAGLGLMGMSGIYGEADDQESLATIRAAADAGITLFDTRGFYGMGHNELLLGGGRRRGIPRESVFIQVKFGGQRDPSGAFIGQDTSPAAVKN